MYLAMIAYVCLVLIRPQDYPQWEDSLSALPLLPGALAIGSLFWLFSSRKSFDAPQYALLCAFFAIMMFSQVVNGWAGGMVLVFGYFMPVVVAFVLMVAALDSRERLAGMMKVLTLCTVVLALHGIEQASIGVGWTGVELSQGTRIQYVGLFNDPNDLGMLFVMSLPMAIHLGYSGSAFSLRRLFWMAMALILLYGILLTDSRGTILATLVLFGVYVWYRWGMVLAGMLGMAAFAAMVVLLPSRMQELDASEESAMGRVDAWYAGIEMFVDSPLFGVGAGGFTDHNPLTAHNSFVLVLAETGAIGFTLWIALIGYCFMMMLAILRSSEEDVLDASEALDDDALGGELLAWMEDRRIALTLLVSMTGFFACAFFLSRSYLVVLYLLLALSVAHYMEASHRWSFLPKFRISRNILRWPVVAGAAAIGLYLLVKVLLSMG